MEVTKYGASTPHPDETGCCCSFSTIKIFKINDAPSFATKGL